MTLEEFATKAGVLLVPCEPDWGGRIAYKTDDHPNMTTCGFNTRSAAYKHWLEDTFGTSTAKAVLKLLKETQK